MIIPKHLMLLWKKACPNNKLEALSSTSLALFLTIAGLPQSLNAEEALQLEGLSREIILEWDGQQSQIHSLLPFCIQTKNLIDKKKAPEPQYLFNVKNRTQFNTSFSATNNQESVPIELYLASHGQPEKIEVGKDIGLDDASAACGKNRLSLKILSTGNLENLAQGEYQANLNLTIKSKDRGLLFEDNLIIRIRIPPITRIRGDREVSLGTFRQEDIRKEARLCYYRNTPGFYNLKIESLSARKGAFELFKQNTSKPESLDYHVRVKTGLQTFSPVTAGEIITNLTGSQHPDCSSRDNLTLQIALLKQDAENVSAGLYRGTLRLTFEVQ